MRPFQKLIPSDRLAISDKNVRLTYREFIDQIYKIKSQYDQQGYHSGHRVSVRGPNTVTTYLYLFAAAIDMCASTLPFGGTEGECDFRIQASNINLIVDVDYQDNVSFTHRHYDQSTVLSKEIMLYYSSGTSHPQGYQNSYPVPYELDENNYGTSLDITHYCRDLMNPYYHSPQTNRTINAMAPYIGWGQDVTFTVVARGGHVHLLDQPGEYDQAAEWVKPTWLAGFPLIWQKVIDTNQGDHKIGVFECSGAKLLPAQIVEFEKFFGHHAWMHEYGDSATGITFLSDAPATIGQPLDCLLRAGAQYRIGQQGTIEFKGLMTPGQDWWDTGDLAKIDKNGNWTLQGRANELIINRGGGKIYPFEVESQLLEHESILEAYVFPQPDEDLGSVPACAYRGDLSPQDVHLWVGGCMQRYKRPVQYFKLSDSLSALQKHSKAAKVNRLTMCEALRQHPDWYDQHLKIA